MVTAAECFGHRWEHWATITNVGMVLDEGGLLRAGTVEKNHEIGFDPGRKLSLLVSPDGDVYILVSRDAGRLSDEPAVPPGWQIVEHTVPRGFETRLAGETVVIRMDNEDSYQGPVAGLDFPG